MRRDDLSGGDFRQRLARGPPLDNHNNRRQNPFMISPRLPGLPTVAALMLAAVLTAWLGVWGPIKLENVKDWQPLIAAVIALASPVLAASLPPFGRTSVRPATILPVRSLEFHNLLKSSGTSPNFRNIVASRKSPVAGSPRSYRPKPRWIASAFSRTTLLARPTKIGIATINSKPITKRVRLTMRLGRLM